MSHSAFELLRTAGIPSLNLTLEEYQHKATGARHFHLSADDNNNAFLVGFLTVPKDSSGVAHILEHTTLCGSRRYPVRDPFFMMSRRSLNTYMNAFTASDWTGYLFASQNRKDFDNLLKVFLDAVFFPNLNELDFAQEGHRLEFEKNDDLESPLVYKGIVFNEMKGALSSPLQALWEKMHENLYPTITYHYNSGGDPAEIPKLSYAQLKAFHQTHYHPSNAIFMTYGNWPAAEHQAHFQKYALKQFQSLAVDFQVGDEKRYAAPLTVNTAYPLDSAENPQDKTHIVLGWLLGKSIDPRELMNVYLLSGVLLDNSASPLRHALETCKLGSAPSPLCGADGSPREIGFYAGVEGSNPEQAEAVEKLILSVLEDVATKGVPQDWVESVLHQIELAQREITGDHLPYGLQLLAHSLGTTLHGGDPLAGLHIDQTLDALREDIKNPDFVKNLVREKLLNNSHRVRLVMAPDLQLSAQRAAEEIEKLAAIKASLSETDRKQLIEQAAALKARQQEPPNPEILPKVTLADVPDELKIPQGKSHPIADLPTTWYAQGTNGMVYQQIIVDLPQLDAEQLDLLPYLCDCLTEVGVGQMDYLSTQARQAAVTGGMRARLSIRSAIEDQQQVQGFFVLSSKALVRNHTALTELLQETFHAARFDELPRLRELVQQLRVDNESRIVSRAAKLTLTAASQGLSGLSALHERWGGISGIHTLKTLDKTLDNPQSLAEFAAKLQALRDVLINHPRQFLIISEAAYQEDIAHSMENCWQNYPQLPLSQSFSLSPMNKMVKQGWTTHTEVNFSAKVYPTVPTNHPDAPILVVLGDFLRNGYLHGAIREQGGAYGSSAGYDADSGAFRFFSYRDPRLSETLADFDRAIDWLRTYPHQPRTLEEAILNVISRIDKPASPAGEAKGAFYGNLHGRAPKYRRQFRHRVLQVSLADLKRVGETYLQPANASLAVLSNAKTLEREAARWELEVRSI